MGYYGTILLARPTSDTLTCQPGLSQAFGTRFGLPDIHGRNELGLHDLGQGWQRVGVTAFYSERLRLAEGAEELAAATGAPVLAAYISESVCTHLEARTPTGLAFSAHLPNTDAPCEYPHPDGVPGLVEPHKAVALLGDWARAGGLTLSPEPVTAIIDGTWSDSPFPEDAVMAIHAALGLCAATEMSLVVHPDDPAFGGFGLEIGRIDLNESARMHAAQMGLEWPAELNPTPRDHDFLRFRRLLWSSAYGGGATRAELIKEYEQLLARWPAA